MKSFIKLIPIIFPLIFLYSCKSNPLPPKENKSINESVYHQILLTQTGYNQIKISNTDNFIISSQKINSIILGEKISGIFSGIDTTKPIYEQSGENYLVKFEFIQQFDSTLLDDTVTIRYLLNDNSFYEMDTAKVTYKYPYSSTEILVPWDKILISQAIDIQDFDIIDSSVFFHPYGPFGLYEYNLITDNTLLKLNYSSGDHLAASKNYIFCDVDHISISRFNIALDTVDLYKHISSNNSINIYGMCYYNNKLYVLTSDGKIIVYNEDLRDLDTITYSFNIVWIAVKDSIVYGNNYNEISRFNLVTKSFLTSVAFPTSDCEAIKIIEDKLYFTDYDKKIIGYVNLSDLK